jgi:cobalt/nickel transport system permease protein
MIGTLFLRSYERGERIYTAMQARGFEGRKAANGISGLGWRDVFFITAIPAYFLTIRLILR